MELASQDEAGAWASVEKAKRKSKMTRLQDHVVNGQECYLEE